MMRRGVLLIGNPGDRYKADEYCKGVFADLKRYKEFFLSMQGGAWDEDEICSLPIYTSSNEVRKALRWLDSMEYSIVVFSGHGGSLGRQTILALSEDCEDVISETEFVKVGRTVILDCCRAPFGKEEVQIKKASRPVFDSWSGITREMARSMYDEAIRQCVGQAVVLYSCSHGQFSEDISGVGGVYSTELLDIAENWCGVTILTVGEAHEMVVNNFENRPDVLQRPQIRKPRMIGARTYPFALGL
ncbi:caspase family protein [Selenomonas sp. AB3002]|uniref:caspase family protein n=1 Tax=Selenomonas sp. AB3002 TaxID=1392502 RepID=UPI000496F53B